MKLIMIKSHSLDKKILIYSDDYTFQKKNAHNFSKNIENNVSTRLHKNKSARVIRKSYLLIFDIM